MKWFLNLNVRLKLLLSFGLLLALTLAVGAQGFWVARALNHRFELMYSRDVAGLAAVKDVEVDKALIARCTRNAILADSNGGEIAAQEKDFVQIFAKLQNDLALAERTENTAEGLHQIKAIRELLPEYEQRARQIFEEMRARDRAAAQATLKQAGSGVIKRLNSAVSSAGVTKQKNVEAARRQADEQFSASCIGMACMLAMAVVLGLGTAIWLANEFSSPIRATAELLKHVAAGDLTRTLDIQTHDELGVMAQALNAAIQQIGSTLAEVGRASKTLTGTSKHLAAAAEQLASGTQEQAASLEETSASLEQITATVRNNSDHAAQASEFTQSSASTAQAGGRVLEQAVAAMIDINAASTKIANINSAVDEIAFKTNLLAVNAAIEAANAGEYGRSFAVVATEVRELARQSSQAATQIRKLIDDSVERIKSGSQLVDQSGKTLSEIVTSTVRVTGIVSEIAAASQEQTKGVEQVSMAISQMDTVMQHNAAQTEQVSATATSVAAQASQLEELVSHFLVA